MSACTTAPSRDPLYRGYRFPAEIISYAMWLYFRFALSHRDIEEVLAERGVQVSYEAIRLWCQRFGPILAGTLRRRRSRSAHKWHIDEVQLKVKGKKHWLWRAVDRDGLVLDILVQARRDQAAAERFLRRVLGGEERAPRVVITDKLASYPPTVWRVLPSTEHRHHKGLNNPAENSHRPVRKRERAQQRFKSPEHAQQFREPFSAVCNHFRPRRHLLSAPQYRRGPRKPEFPRQRNHTAPTRQGPARRRMRTPHRRRSGRLIASPPDESPGVRRGVRSCMSHTATKKAPHGGLRGLCYLEPTRGLEPLTCCLRNSCSTTELHRRGAAIVYHGLPGSGHRGVQRTATGVAGAEPEQGRGEGTGRGVAPMLYPLRYEPCFDRDEAPGYPWTVSRGPCCPAAVHDPEPGAGAVVLCSEPAMVPRRRGGGGHCGVVLRPA